MKALPITVIRSIELLGLVLLITVLYVGSSIIMPVLLSFFISIMLLPVYRFFRKRKIPEIMSIILPILLLALFLAVLVWFFSSQISVLISEFDQIKKNVGMHLEKLSKWIESSFNYSATEQTKFINEQSNNILNSLGNILGGAMGSFSNFIIFFGLLPIYIFLMLFYKNLFLKFIFTWFRKEDHEKVKEGLKESEEIIKSYLLGLLIQITYMTILLGGLLLILGIKHALLIGVIFAILNLIPYIGALFGNIIGVLLTLSSSQELSSVFTVLIVIAIVQFLDNNILMPRIVGSKVKINAFAAIIGVVIGGSVAGISGMFLALPMIAVFKIIFDRTETLKHWGVLLADERPKDGENMI
ncbi:AI-2E family transporter [Pseudopedobacter beijingensis]|uniref:AI-2E family transporter n=1 Tax=Pseudopedobacter beijingensis TaxID=1207056 RepID=A0ABW4IKB3_9SPHI